MLFRSIIGKITKSRVLTKEDTTQNDNGSTDTSITYVPQVIYHYELNGNIFENDRIAILDQQTFSNKDKADKYISQFPEGNNLKVYYNPSNPKESFIDNSISKNKIDGGTWMLIILLMAGAIYFLFDKN